MVVVRLTVKCHKLSNVSFYIRTYREPLRTTHTLSSLFRVGKILMYVNIDYHKFNFSALLNKRLLNFLDYVFQR